MNHDLTNTDFILAALPTVLFDRVVTHSVGRLEDRARAILTLRQAWLRAEWPGEPLCWPAVAAIESLREWITRPEHDLLRLCRGCEEFTDELLLDVLAAFERFDHDADVVRNELLAQLRTEDGEGESVSQGDQTDTLAELLDGLPVEMQLVLVQILLRLWIHVAEEIERHVAPRAASQGIGRLHSKWHERITIWKQLEEVFGPLAGRLGLGWDLSAGVFQSGGWRDFKKYRDLIDRIPEIRQLIEQLGRLQDSEDIDDDPKFADLFRSLKRTQEEQREIEHPLARHQAQGVERSDDFMRMIPSEAMLRRRPALKRLWHAKLAERGLLTYRVRGTYVDRVSNEVDEQQPQSRRRIRGPIIVCIDTSGSMSGAPEAVAKALVLEACRTAHAENRRCLLFSFSGPNQCAEHELSLTPDGLQSLLEFLTMNFDGGTDISTPFREALSRLRTAEWERADILLVSDGDFSKSQVDALKPGVDESRARLKLRVAGLLVGCSRTSPMSNLCDPLILVRDWK